MGRWRRRERRGPGVRTPVFQAASSPHAERGATAASSGGAASGDTPTSKEVVHEGAQATRRPNVDGDILRGRFTMVPRSGRQQLALPPVAAPPMLQLELPSSPATSAATTSSTAAHADLVSKIEQKTGVTLPPCDKVALQRALDAEHLTSRGPD
jgi:hypothetical protein